MSKIENDAGWEETDASISTRARIVAAAAELLIVGGRDALTTRAVATAAKVQAPTIYRLFSDKNGLLDAVAERGFAAYIKEKKIRESGLEFSDPSGPHHSGSQPSDLDPIENLRSGWDLHIGFGLTNPALYTLMYGEPRSGKKFSAAAASEQMLKALIHQIATAGRLRVSEERAAAMVHASGCGTVFTLLSMEEGLRDLGLSEMNREAVIAAITWEVPSRAEPAPAAAAIALHAVLPEITVLSAAERQLLGEWLGRLVAEWS